MKKLSPVLFALLYFTFAHNANAVELLRYWEFNDNSDPATTLDTLEGEPGTLEGGAAYTADAGGRTGAAGDYGMDFGVDNNGQTVRISDATFLNEGTDTVTFSFWQTLNSVASTSTFWAVSPGSSGTERGAQAHVPWGNGTIFFDTAGCCDANTQRLQGTPPAGHDFLEWHHYAFLKDGATKEVWIDGTMALTGSNTSPLPTDFTELFLGSQQGNNSLQGTIDDFAVFDDALTPDDIGRLAQGESALDIVVPRTAPYLPMDLPGPSGGAGSWGVREITDNGTLDSLATAVESATGGGGTITDGQLPILDVTDPDTNPQGGPILSTDPSPFLSNTGGDDDNITSVAKGTVRVTEPGDYTIQVNANDGFAMRIVDQEWTSVNGGTIDSLDPNTLVSRSRTTGASVRGVINLAAGEYDVEVVAYEGADEAFYEVTSAQGIHPAANTAQWIAIGDVATVLDEREILPLVTMADEALVVNGGPAGDVAAAREEIMTNGLGGDLIKTTDALVLFDPGASACPNGPGQQQAEDELGVTFPINDENGPGLDNFSTGVLGTLNVDDGDDVLEEEFEITFGMFSDDRGQFRIVGENFVNATGNSTTLVDVEGDMVMNSEAASCNTNSIGHIVLTEGLYEYQGIHTEQGGNAGWQIWWADGFVNSAGGDMIPLTTSLDPLGVFPPNAGLELVGTGGPDPSLDFNGDAAINTDDIDLLMTEAAGAASDTAFDLNGDGVVDDLDRDEWLAGAGPANGFADGFLLGDANLDGSVTPADLNQVGINWQSDVVTNWSQGNFTGAGVNAGDLNVLALNWNESIAPAAAAVPEPAGLLLLTIGACFVFARRRQSQ